MQMEEKKLRETEAKKKEAREDERLMKKIEEENERLRQQEEEEKRKKREKEAEVSKTTRWTVTVTFHPYCETWLLWMWCRFSHFFGALLFQIGRWAFRDHHNSDIGLHFTFTCPSDSESPALPPRPSTPLILLVRTLYLNITFQLIPCTHLTLICCQWLVSVHVLVLEDFCSCCYHFEFSPFDICNSCSIASFRRQLWAFFFNRLPSLVLHLIPVLQILRVSCQHYCALYQFVYLLTYRAVL